VQISSRSFRPILASKTRGRLTITRQQFRLDSRLMDTLIIKISGMRGDDCVRAVANAIQDLPHIGHVEVSLEKDEAIVEYGRLIEPDDIVRAIEDAGFPASC
jgi:copper chaperone